MNNAFKKFKTERPNDYKVYFNLRKNQILLIALIIGAVMLGIAIIIAAYYLLIFSWFLSTILFVIVGFVAFLKVYREKLHDIMLKITFFQMTFKDIADISPSLRNEIIEMFKQDGNDNK